MVALVFSLAAWLGNRRVFGVAPRRCGFAARTSFNFMVIFCGFGWVILGGTIIVRVEMEVAVTGAKRRDCSRRLLSIVRRRDVLELVDADQHRW